MEDKIKSILDDKEFINKIKDGNELSQSKISAEYNRRFKPGFIEMMKVNNTVGKIMTERYVEVQCGCSDRKFNIGE